MVLLTSYYTVEAESEGVVLRFGKFLKTVEPGLHFKMPFGIDVVTAFLPFGTPPSSEKTEIP